MAVQVFNNVQVTCLSGLLEKNFLKVEIFFFEESTEDVYNSIVNFIVPIRIEKVFVP